MKGCLKFGVVVMGGQATTQSAVNHHRQANVESTWTFSPRWGGAVCRESELMSSEEWKAERKMNTGHTNVENQHPRSWIMVCEERQTAPLFHFCLRFLLFLLLYPLPPPSAWWCVFAVFAFKLNGKQTHINKCLCFWFWMRGDRFSL